jgi:hypothetical protein
MRHRAMSAGAAFSGSVAAFCLGTALTSGARGPICAFLAGVAAAIALARGVLRGCPDEAQLRLCPRRGLLLGEDGDGDGEAGAEADFRPIGVTRNLICLVRTRRVPQRRTIWRDSLAPDAFRRIAAYALWRRSAIPNPGRRSELITRKTVTGGHSAPRTGRPRGQ